MHGKPAAGDRLRVLGAMSGTSLDGVDWAIIESDGERVSSLGPWGYRAYCESERETLRGALGCWDGERAIAAGQVVTRAHIEALNGVGPIDLVGFHGQTLAHDPRGRGTLQVGDGAALAAALGVPVVWDYRSADVSAGGEGAPLTPFFHFACARWIGVSEPLGFLNLGGVGNLTWVNPSLARPELANALLAFDTGPANAPVDDLMRLRQGKALDRNGCLAERGRVDERVVADFLLASYFAAPIPKSLDRDGFGEILDCVAHLSDADAVATLLAMGAAAVEAGVKVCRRPFSRIFVTGGGRRNPVMMRMLGERLAGLVEPVENAGLNGDMVEAQAMAFLAVRTLRGLPISSPTTTGVPYPQTGGRISYPDRRTVPT